MLAVGLEGQVLMCVQPDIETPARFRDVLSGEFDDVQHYGYGRRAVEVED